MSEKVLGVVVESRSQEESYDWVVTVAVEIVVGQGGVPRGGKLVGAAGEGG